jgi:hypothetical protein
MKRKKKKAQTPTSVRAKTSTKRGVKPAAKRTAKTTRKGRAPQKAKAIDPIAVIVAASAQALALPLDPAWQEAVTFNLQLIFRHAALVDEFPLPDEAEPAPVFHA